MTEHLTEDQFQKYKNRKLPISELLVIGEHLAQCNQCREKLGWAEERAAILEALTRALRSAILKDPQHSSHMQSARYEDCVLERQLHSGKPSVKKIQLKNRFATIWRPLIEIIAILMLFGLLVMIPFQIQINYMRGQHKNKNHINATTTQKQLSVPPTVHDTKSK